MDAFETHSTSADPNGQSTEPKRQNAQAPNDDATNADRPDETVIDTEFVQDGDGGQDASFDDANDRPHAEEPREFTAKDVKRLAKAIRKFSDMELIDLSHKARQWESHGGDMAKMKAEADRNIDLARRAQADFDNYQKRAERMRREDLRYANVSLIRDLLPSIDNLQRAIDAANKTKDVEALATGVSMTLTGLERALTDHGLVAIDAKGQAFDPEHHEAVMTGVDDAIDDNTVLDCFERGWKLHDRVIRPAKVRVNQKS